MFKTVEYHNGAARMIDQTKLPGEKVFIDCHTIEEVGQAIKSMVIRGAPAIGVAAAIGASLGANGIHAKDFDAFYHQFEEKCAELARSRPTAVNLAWSIERMKRVARESKELDLPALKKRLKQEAIAIHDEDISANKSIGAFGKELIENGNVVLTHCNAGALATAGYGTALGVIRAAVESGKNVQVMANETRPFLQGARLTVWELKEDGIPVKLITDGMSGFFMQKKPDRPGDCGGGPHRR